MNTILIFITTYIAMIALAFVESYVEGRNVWNKKKIGWKIKLTKNFTFTGYHFFLFFIMLPAFFALPLVVTGWNKQLFGILLSAYFSGMVIEDFAYFIVSPVIKFKEFFSKFTDYYPWIKINNKKIIPVGYAAGIIITIASWYFIWK